MTNFSNRLFGSERQYVEEVLAGEFRTSLGSTMMNRFETAFANRFNAPHAISFINGTATMHAALEAAGVGVGDEVIVPPLTMSATTFAVLQANASLYLLMLTQILIGLTSLYSIENYSRTKAVITVALWFVT